MRYYNTTNYIHGNIICWCGCSRQPVPSPPPPALPPLHPLPSNYTSQYSVPTQISQAFPVHPSQHSQVPQLHKPFPANRREKRGCELRAVPSCPTFHKVPLFTPGFPPVPLGWQVDGDHRLKAAQDMLCFATETVTFKGLSTTLKSHFSEASQWRYQKVAIFILPLDMTQWRCDKEL